MNFLFPTFLYALAAIAIPIIIHLFNFRRHKTILFSNISFLKNIKKETKAKSELKHLLILIARILAIVFLVLAFSKPYIPLSEDVINTNNNKVAIYIDNSFSMNADSKYGNLLEVAKNTIPELINAFSPNTEYLITDNTFSSRHQNTINKDELIEIIKDIEPSADFKNLSEIISRQDEFFKDEISGKVKKSRIILSDFQKTSIDFKNITNNQDINTILIPLSTQITNNLFIDSCYFETPGRKFGGAEELFVRIVNNSAENFSNNPVKLFLNDSLRALSSFSVDPNSYVIVKLSYTNTQKGIINGRIEINDYPIIYDNELYFNYVVAEKINILSISYKSDNRFIDAMFKDDDYFQVSHNLENQINYSNFPEYRLLILSDLESIASGLRKELEKYITNGGSVLLFPSDNINIDSYNQFFESLASSKINSFDTSNTTINKVNFEHPLYKDVFRKIDQNLNLPEISNHYVFEKRTRSNDEVILSGVSGNSILHKTKPGLGEIYISSVPLNTDSYSFSTHPILLPAIYNMALNSAGNSKLYSIIGKDKSIKINRTIHKQAPVHLINKALEFDFLPESNVTPTGISLYIDNFIKLSGNYSINSENRTLEGISFNYNRKESDLECFSKNEIDNNISENNLTNFTILENNNEQLNSNFGDLQHGVQLWKLFLIICLIFIITEIGIIKFMR